jgi:hypothetical protein
MLWIFRVFNLFSCWWTYFIFFGFSGIIRTVNASLLFIKVWCLCLACRTWVDIKVLVYDGHDWACKCWSTRGMSGHESAKPLKGMFYPSSAGTLTFIRTIEICVESILPPYPNDLQWRIISFILVRTVRSCVHIIKLANRLSNMTILKSVILAKF